MKASQAELLGVIGGEGGIRTHVAYAHPLSRRRRYDRFGTSPFKRCFGFVPRLNARILVVALPPAPFSSATNNYFNSYKDNAKLPGLDIF